MAAPILTPDAYIQQLSSGRKDMMSRLRKSILDHLPEGFTETISYGMIGYVVPHSIYPDGYHCNPKLPLPFISIASQKNFIAFYHMGLYGDPSLMNWFVAEYAKVVPDKPDMGKSCIRFKKPEQIPFALIGELCSKISVAEWIHFYEANWKK